VDIKSTRKYDLSFFSNGKTCELSCLSFGNSLLGSQRIRLPLNLEEAIKLHEALEIWIEKRKSKGDSK
jgi:hypothetical protein